ncbi:MAG: iron-containing alcohol dehydrogenase [Bryobacteraceae bacterium]
MVKPFEFAAAGRILFGLGMVRELNSASKTLGRRPLLVTGSRTSAFEKDRIVLRITGEPTVDKVREATRFARENQCDHVIGLGGGSVIDAGKAIAALLANGPEPLDYLEVIGKGHTLANPSVPFIAIPTTAGTGAEVTRNAVLSSPEHGVKASLRSPSMLPTVAIVDPELTYSLPLSITASTGVDALTQLIEPYVSIKANPLTDGFCIEGLRCASRSLRVAFTHPGDTQARTEMALASLLSGLALANAGLGAVHGFAAPIGGMFQAPHGAVCAALLPAVTQVNIQAVRGRDDALARYETIARILTGRPQATADDLVPWLREACGALEIPPLHSYGITSEHFADLASKAASASSMKGNPVKLTAHELQEILEHAL